MYTGVLIILSFSKYQVQKSKKCIRENRGENNIFMLLALDLSLRQKMMKLRLRKG